MCWPTQRSLCVWLSQGLNPPLLPSGRAITHLLPTAQGDLSLKQRREEHILDS